MSSLALHDATQALAHHHERFNALAAVAARGLPKFLVPMTVPVISIGFSAVGAAAAAKFGTKGMVALGVLSAIGYGVGFMSNENADLRWGAYSVAMGLGSAVSTILTYEKVTSMIAATTAPPAPAAAAA